MLHTQLPQQKITFSSPSQPKLLLLYSHESTRDSNCQQEVETASHETPNLFTQLF